jgi:hypothetical protein
MLSLPPDRAVVYGDRPVPVTQADQHHTVERMPQQFGPIQGPDFGARANVELAGNHPVSRVAATAITVIWILAAAIVLWWVYRALL